ncbi:MAG: hypothetical protein AAF810_00170 [Cyanobacteria bacterium P01_D01_bin.36]
MTSEGRILVDGKVLGRRRPLFTDWAVPLPPVEGSGNSPLTLRDLIICVVKAEVSSFQSRQADARLQKILSRDDIAQGLVKGKVTMGDRDLSQFVDVDSAIDVAILGFIDGLYYVFIDEVQQENLDAPVYLQPDSRLMFLRLVALVGG